MTIAFLIIAHADAPHLKRLCDRLSGHDIFVHWDRKAGPVPDIPAVTFTRERSSVFWAGFSQVVATIHAMRAALASGKTYDKLVLLSGSCYPIRAINELEQMFASDGGRNYINAVAVDRSEHLSSLVSRRLWRDQMFPLAIPRTSKINQVERLVRAGANALIERVPKPHPKGITLYHGSTWWAMSPAAAAHSVNIFDTNQALRHFYEYTFASDEQFFHTVLRNSEFAGFCAPPIADTTRGTFKTANLHIVDPSLTKWFDFADRDLIAASDRFFVRKVRSTTSGTLLDWIDEHRLAAHTAVIAPEFETQ